MDAEKRGATSAIATYDGKPGTVTLLLDERGKPIPAGGIGGG